MASEKLASIPEVEIDSDGTFKYILIKVYGAKGSASPDEVKTIVRGFKWGEYHGKKQNTVFYQFFVSLHACILISEVCYDLCDLNCVSVRSLVCGLFNQSLPTSGV